MGLTLSNSRDVYQESYRGYLIAKERLTGLWTITSRQCRHPDEYATLASARNAVDNQIEYAHPELPRVARKSRRGRALLASRERAAQAATAALHALYELIPEPRDYQAAPKGTYEKARAQYERRRTLLQELEEELEEERDALRTPEVLLDERTPAP